MIEYIYFDSFFKVSKNLPFLSCFGINPRFANLAANAGGSGIFASQFDTTFITIYLIKYQQIAQENCCAPKRNVYVFSLFEVMSALALWRTSDVLINNAAKYCSSKFWLAQNRKLISSFCRVVFQGVCFVNKTRN